MVSNPLTMPQRNSIRAINMKGTQQYWYVQDEHGTQHAVCGPCFNYSDCSHFQLSVTKMKQVEFLLLLELRSTVLLCSCLLTQRPLGHRGDATLRAGCSQEHPDPKVNFFFYI